MKSQAQTQAERKLVDILGMIHYDTTSLTHALVKASRAGMPKESVDKATGLLLECVRDMDSAVKIAIAQPENRSAIRPVVEL